MRGFMRICGATIGLAVAAINGLIAVLAASASAWPPTSNDITGVTVFLLIAAAGAALAHWSVPGVFQSGVGMAASLARRFAGRLNISYPEGLAFWTFVVAAVLLPIAGAARILVVLGAFVIYLLVSALMLLIAPGWWYRLVFTLIASIVMVFGLVSISELLQPRSIGEGGLAILGPLMFSWVVLPAIVLLRVLLRALRARPE